MAEHERYDEQNKDHGLHSSETKQAEEVFPGEPLSRQHILVGAASVCPLTEDSQLESPRILLLPKSNLVLSVEIQGEVFVLIGQRDDWGCICAKVTFLQTSELVGDRSVIGVDHVEVLLPNRVHLTRHQVPIEHVVFSDLEMVESRQNYLL